MSELLRKGVELVRRRLGEWLVQSGESESLVGVALLSQPEMGTLQADLVRRDTEVHEDLELFLVAVEWGDPVELDISETLLSLFVSQHDFDPDDAASLAAYGDFIDECCVSALQAFIEAKPAKCCNGAIFVYTRLDATDDEYIEWFTEINGSEHEMKLRAILEG